MFSPRQVIFSKLFYCSGRRQQKLSKKVVFLGFQKRQNLQKLSKNVVFLGFQKPREGVFRRRFVASSSFTAMVFKAGGSRVLAAWKVEVLNLFLA